MPWRLIPVDLPPAKHRWKKFLKKLYENGGNLQEPSGGSSQSTEGSPTPERILKKNILPNGAENITVVVFNKGNKSGSDKKEKPRKVRRTPNDFIQSPDSSSSSRPSHSLDNLPSSYQRSNLTERQDRTPSHDRSMPHDKPSTHDRPSHSRKSDRRSGNGERGSRSELLKNRHSEPGNPPLRPWFRSHDMVEDYRGHRPPDELPHQYRSSYATNFRISLDTNSPRKVFDDSYPGPSRYRRHSDEPKRNKTPYSRPHDARTPAQDRLLRLEKHLKDDRERKVDYPERGGEGSDIEQKRRKSPEVKIDNKPVNGALECDDEALCVWEVKADETDFKRNGIKCEDLSYSPAFSEAKSPDSMCDRFSSKYTKKLGEDRASKNSRHSPSSDSKCSSDSYDLKHNKSTLDDHSSSYKDRSKSTYQSNLYKRRHKKLDNVLATEKLKALADSLPDKTQRVTSPEMMDWSPIDYEVIHSEIQELRNNGLVNSLEISNKPLVSSLNPNNHTMEKTIFVVTDTNVMCTNLVTNFRNVSLGGIDLVIYVPWQVLMELDALKSSKRAIARQAQNACSMMSDRSNQSSGWLRFQPPQMYEAQVDGMKPETPDDFILLAALQLKGNGHSVILLTNDKNLLAKTEAAGVKNFSEISLIKVISLNNHKPDIVPLEEQPSELEKTPESLMAYQLAECFKNLLTVCLERLKEVRGDLWVLYVAVLPPWSLLDTIKAARSSWDIICPDKTNHYKQFSLLNSIQHFLKDTSYNDLSVKKLHTLFDECCTLATSLPVHFTTLADSFISQAKEILDEHLNGSECPNIIPKISESDDVDELTSEESASNIIDQFDVFSHKLLSFCGYVYRLKGIEWPSGESNPGENSNLSPEFIRDYIPFSVSTLETIISSLDRLSSVKMGHVGMATDGVASIHKCLADFNGKLYKYSVRDVACFANNPQVRLNLNSGIIELKKLSDILNKIV